MRDRHVVHLVLNDEQVAQLRHAVAYWADLKRLWREEQGTGISPTEIAAEQVADMVWQDRPWVVEEVTDVSHV